MYILHNYIVAYYCDFYSHLIKNTSQTLRGGGLLDQGHSSRLMCCQLRSSVPPVEPFLGRKYRTAQVQRFYLKGVYILLQDLNFYEFKRLSFNTPLYKL